MVDASSAILMNMLAAWQVSRSALSSGVSEGTRCEKLNVIVTRVTYLSPGQLGYS
jgi:hypothetical protein